MSLWRTSAAPRPEPSTGNLSPAWAPALATLLTASFAVFVTTFWLRPRTLSTVFGGALLAISFTWLLSALSAWVGYALLRFQSGRRLPHSPWLLPALAVWLVPVGAMLRINSPLAALPAMALAASVAILLRRAPAGPVPATISHEWPAFALLPPGPRRTGTLTFALMLQAGVAAIFMQRPIYAAAFFAVTAAMAATRTTRRQFLFKPGLTITAATLLTVFAFLQLLPGLPGGSASAFAKTGATPKRPTTEDPGRRANLRPMDDGHIGIILYPEEQKHITLVPPLAAGQQALFTKERTPLSIPFYGAYWFFRPPDHRPPPDSLVTRGKPTDFKLTAQGMRPLNMEARQNLGTMIDFACCRRLDIYIQNGDRYPATIGLEVTLINSTLPGIAEVSLGTQRLTSLSAPGPGDDRIPTPETIQYNIPSATPFRQFDEIRTVFRLSPARMSRSAMVSIDRFVLVPR